MRHFLYFFTLLTVFAVTPFWHCNGQERAVQIVDVHRAKSLFDDGILFIDLRGNANWEAERIANAMHLQYPDYFAAEVLFDLVSLDDAVVLYGEGGLAAGKLLLDGGFKTVYYFKDGYAEWVKQDYPVE